MKRYLLDTNVFLRFLLSDVPQLALEAENYFKKAKQGRILLSLPQIVVFEIAFALEKEYKFKRSKIVEHLKPLLTAPYIEVEDRNLFLEAMDLYEEKSLSLVDVFLFYKAKDANAEVLSFDKRLKKLKT